MRRRPNGTSATLISVTTLLEPGELTRLDHMVRFLHVDRAEVLRRGLICLSAAGDATFGHLGFEDVTGYGLQDPHQHSRPILSQTPHTDALMGR